MTTRFLHTMLRITDPERSRAFYEALGFTFARDMDIVRNGELEATNYFFSLGDQESVLELTFNHDGRTYELGTAYGHVAIGVDDLDGTLARLKEQGIEPERPPYQVREGGSWIAFVLSETSTTGMTLVSFAVRELNTSLEVNVNVGSEVKNRPRGCCRATQRRADGRYQLRAAGSRCRRHGHDDPARRSMPSEGRSRQRRPRSTSTVAVAAASRRRFYDRGDVLST